MVAHDVDVSFVPVAQMHDFALTGVELHLPHVEHRDSTKNHHLCTDRVTVFCIYIPSGLVKIFWVYCINYAN